MSLSERVAAVAVCLQNYGGERFRQVFSSSGAVADIVGQFFDVIPISIRRDARPVKCGKRQRALSQVMAASSRPPISRRMSSA